MFYRRVSEGEEKSQRSNNSDLILTSEEWLVKNLKMDVVVNQKSSWYARKKGMRITGVGQQTNSRDLVDTLFCE